MLTCREQMSSKDPVMVADEGGTTVLLVEDDDDIRLALAEILTDCGYRVRMAEHGGRALELLEAGLRPAIMLLDLMMPVMDGWELLARLAGSRALADIPVLTVSASRSPTPAGACGSLPKPLDVDDLLAAMERAQAPAPPSAVAFGTPRQRPGPGQARPH
jgi:CheY-like chemotaxis protein